MPNLNIGAIELAKRYGKIICPGALTPTEIVTAQQAGADIIKIFPASSFGPGYIKAIRAPLPQMRLMPVGGMNLENVEDYFRAGASAVGVGGSLANSELIGQGNWSAITDLARQYVQAVQKARDSRG